MPATPPVQKFKLRGNEYTLDDILKNPELSQALVQTYEQFPVLQKKYIEMLEGLRAEQQQRQQAAQRQQPPPMDPRQFQAQLLAKMAPEINNVVRSGFIEEDAATLYPNWIAQQLAHRDLLYELRDEFRDFKQANQGQTRKAEETTHRSTLTANLNALAGQGEIFAPLKDPREQQAFLEFLVNEIDPYVDRLTPEWLARQWIGFKHETITAAAQAVTAREQAERESARRRAVSDGKGSRPGAVAPAGQPSHLEFLIEGQLPRR